MQFLPCEGVGLPSCWEDNGVFDKHDHDEFRCIHVMMFDGDLVTGELLAKIVRFSESPFDSLRARLIAHSGSLNLLQS